MRDEGKVCEVVRMVKLTCAEIAPKHGNKVDYNLYPGLTRSDNTL